MSLRKYLSDQELLEIDSKITEISELVDFLDPSKPTEKVQIDYYENVINECISMLEKSYKNIRIQEIGLKIIY